MSELYYRQPFSGLKGRGQTVTVVGKVTKVNPEENSIYIECDPQNKSTVSIKAQSKDQIMQIANLKFIEVRGRCTGPRQIQMEQFTDFKENFDLKSYNQMLNYATTQFKELFM